MYVKRLAQCLAHRRLSINLSFPLSNLGIFFLSPTLSPQCSSPRAPGSFLLGGRAVVGGTPFLDGNSLPTPVSPSPDSPSLAPHSTPAGSSHCPGALPPPPFRAWADSAWVNLAANSAGAGASPRLSLRVLARPSARALPPRPPPPGPPAPTPAQHLDLQSRSQTAYSFGLQLSRGHSPPAPERLSRMRRGLGGL